MYQVILSNKAEKQLGKLERPLQERIVTALERIRIRPEAYITKLVGEQLYKFRVGDYRIIIDIDQGLLRILVVKIAHRKNVYDYSKLHK